MHGPMNIKKSNIILQNIKAPPYCVTQSNVIVFILRERTNLCTCCQPDSGKC